LQNIDISAMTPLESLNTLSELIEQSKMTMDDE
jgi:hypothetical protein